QGFYLVDVVTGMILNVLLLISGIGLVRLKEWGRVTGLWVAAIKIARLVVIYSINIVVIVPIMTKQFADMFEDIARAAPPGPRGAGAPAMTEVGPAMGTMMTAAAIGIMIVGSIYPAIVLWLLSRPGVKAACTNPRPAYVD